MACLMAVLALLALATLAFVAGAIFVALVVVLDRSGKRFRQ